MKQNFQNKMLRNASKEDLLEMEDEMAVETWDSLSKADQCKLQNIWNYRR